MINPAGMTAIEWTDRMALLLPEVTAMKIFHETDWRAWARHVLQSPRVARFNPPNPDYFDNWRVWADRFNQVVPVN